MTTAEYNTISFPKLGWNFVVDSDAFQIFGFSIKWYGILIALGLLLALLYCFRRMDKFGVDADRAFDVVFGGIIGAFIGARLYYVFMMWDDYKNNLNEIFSFRMGGLAVYGGLIGAVLVGSVIAKFRKVKMLPMLDVASLGFLIGQSIGRWGNFFNHECFGSNTSLPWGMTSPRIAEQISYEMAKVFTDTGVELNPSLPVHPCFLYESLWCALGFLLLHLYSKRRKFDGEVFFLYIGWYGFGRMIIEGLRTDSLMLGYLRVSQVLAGICVVVSIIVILAMRRKVIVDGYTFYKDTDHYKERLAETKAKEHAYIEKQQAKKAAKSEKKNPVLKQEDKLTDDMDNDNTGIDNETEIAENSDAAEVKEEDGNGTDN